MRSTRKKATATARACQEHMWQHAFVIPITSKVSLFVTLTIHVPLSSNLFLSSFSSSSSLLRYSPINNAQQSSIQTNHQCKPSINANRSSIETNHWCKPIIDANRSFMRTNHQCQQVINAVQSSMQTNHQWKQNHECKPIIKLNQSSVQTSQMHIYLVLTARASQGHLRHFLLTSPTVIGKTNEISTCSISHQHTTGSTRFSHHSTARQPSRQTNHKYMTHVTSNTRIHTGLEALGCGHLRSLSADTSHH